MPTVQQALQRLARELANARQGKAHQNNARQNNVALLKLVHGYGSTGVGGEIRTAVQKYLLEKVKSGEIRHCIFGENWSKSDENAWKLLQAQPELKNDSDLGRRNQGITIVVL